jgi:hypothetical protein
MIKRIKQMNKGMFRLFLCLYPIFVLAAFVMTPALMNTLDGVVGNHTHKTNVFSLKALSDSIFIGDGKIFFDGCFVAVFAALAYWLFVRMCLWIYDGFQSERQSDKK